MAGLGRRMRAVVLGTLPSCYAALSVGDPGDACATLNEPVIGVNGYERRLVTWEPTATPLSGSPAILYCWSTIFWTSTGPWAVSLTQPISHVALFSGATGTAESTYLGSASLLPPRLIDRAGIVITIPAYALQLSIGLKEN